jgi:multidrug resistance protein, MATE family
LTAGASQADGDDAGAAARFVHSVRRIAPLAWPVFIGQLAVLAFATVDTVLVARLSPIDLAALAVGSAVFVTVFLGFMGVVLGVGPIVGQLFGAGRLEDAGRQAHQAVWIALALSCVGSTALAFPGPFLALARASPEVADKVRMYLLALAFSLPASLLFTVLRGFTGAVSRPKAVMALQLGGLALKLPLSAALVLGVPGLSIPALGVVGCGIATCVAMWAQLLGGVWLLRRDAFYARFKLLGRPGLGLDAPRRRDITALLRLGLPIGGSIFVEVTSFAYMALFISRLGTTAVAGHQIAANLASLMFMVPLALGNATGALVAQRIGAADPADARRLGWHGLLLACAVAALISCAAYLLRAPLVGAYTHDGAVVAAALPLMAWLVWFHVGDAAQTLVAFVLRAYRIATVPLAVYLVALWGAGLGGGYVLAFDVTGNVPVELQGARGFWAAASAGLALAALALCAFLVWMFRQQRRVAAQPRG